MRSTRHVLVRASLVSFAVLATASPSHAITSWSYGFGAANNDTGRMLARSSTGDVVITGSFAGAVNFGGGTLTAAGGSDAFLVKFDVDGVHQWSKRFGDTANDEGFNVVVDDLGNVFVTGAFAGSVDFGGGPLASAGGTDVFVARYDAAGLHQWSKRFGDTGDDAGLGLGTSGGNVLLAGSFSGSVNFGGGVLDSAGGLDAFMVKLNSSGVHQWSKRFGGAGSDLISSLAFSGAKIVVTGRFEGSVDFGGGTLMSAGDSDIFLAQYGDNALHNWSLRFGSSGYDSGNAVACDNSGNIVFTGTCMGTVNLGGGDLTTYGGRDILLAKYGVGGSHLWSKRFGSPGDDSGFGIATATDASVVVAGSFVQTIEFLSGYPVSSQGDSDVFFLKHTSGGAFSFAVTSGGTGTDGGYSIAIDDIGLISSTGYFSDTANFGAGPLTSAGATDIYVLANRPVIGGGGGPPACSDGLDNDGDGCVDYPADPGCSELNDDSEAEATCVPACSDGVDNDGDGCVDYPDDLGCYGYEDESESEAGCAGPPPDPGGSPSPLYRNYTRVSVWSRDVPRDNGKVPLKDRPAALGASAAANTLVLAAYSFNAGATCSIQGWTTVDLTAPTGTYWHVDDMASSNALGSIPPGQTSTGGMAFIGIQGTKCLWMGKRIPPAGPIDTIHCGYQALPGYGNNWNQSWCSKSCVPVSGGPTSDLDLSFILRYDTQPSYDIFSIEYTTDCTGNTGWTPLDRVTGVGSARVAASLVVGTDPVRVRLRFTSDGAGSNEDGLYPGLGALVDSLTLESLYEDFEGEALGATSSNDWIACNSSGYGNYLALFKKATGANHEDQCRDNLSCYWAAINGSTDFYACGVPAQPAQKVVPYLNVRGQYISNEIWSPAIPLAGAGSDFRLRYTVYRDLPLGNLVFGVWHVRTIDNTGCPGPWKDRRYVYYGDGKDWAEVENAVGSKLNLATGVSMQVAIGVVDMCGYWCGVSGYGSCHSPAPYMDSVKVLRIGTFGPQWDVRDIDRFQDTFSEDGDVFGTARADAAIDIRPMHSPFVTRGDSATCLSVVDPAFVGSGVNSSGLSADPVLSTFVGRDKTKRALYMYVAVFPTGHAHKTGAGLAEGPAGQASRYPFMGNQIVNGVNWSKIRFDYTYVDTPNLAGVGIPGQPRVDNCFNVDLRDDLFTPADTILYFYSATSPGGTTYYSSNWGTTDNISIAADNPMEFTILPAGGWLRGGDILYVDGADGSGDQQEFEGAFLVLGLRDKIDRFDVNGPSSGVSNRLGGHVYNISEQLNGIYKKILWDCGTFAITLGDGTGNPEKQDDYWLLNTFLAGLGSPGGVYLCGDRVAQNLQASPGSSAATFRSSYIPFSLVAGNHRLAPTLYPISPQVLFWPGRAYSDNFIVSGTCPQLNDFDVMNAAGTSLAQMSYVGQNNPNAAVLSNENGNARVVLSGFAFPFIRDDENDGISDRAKFLRDTLVFLGNALGGVTRTGDSPARNHLAQNYPNPFNPQTTISYSIQKPGHVRLAVYSTRGELVRTLVNEPRPTGPHSVTWDGRNGDGTPVASGIYFYRLVTDGFVGTKKMVLLK